MKKTLLSLFAVALAANIQAAEPTLLQEWTTDANMPARTDARSGAGYNGKFYVNEKGTGVHCYSYDQNTGAVIKETVSGVSALGIGPVFDSKGTAIFINAFASAVSSTEFLLWNTNTNETKSLSITLPEGYAACRMDFIGRAVGDLWGEGGAFFIYSTHAASAVDGVTNKDMVKVYVANCLQDESKTKLITVNKSVDNSTIVIPLTDDPEKDIVAYRYRSGKDFYSNVNGNWKAYPQVGAVNTGAGGDVVTLDNVVYTIEPAGTAYYDGFQVVRRDNNTVVATIEEHTDETYYNKTSYGTCLSAEKVDEKTAYIYRYHPGSCLTKYVFTTDQDVITGVEETMVDANAPVEYYNLQGVKVADPENGLFIKKQGGKTAKIVL